MHGHLIGIVIISRTSNKYAVKKIILGIMQRIIFRRQRQFLFTNQINEQLQTSTGTVNSEDIEMAVDAATLRKNKSQLVLLLEAFQSKIKLYATNGRTTLAQYAFAS